MSQSDFAWGSAFRYLFHRAPGHDSTVTVRLKSFASPSTGLWGKKYSSKSNVRVLPATVTGLYHQNSVCVFVCIVFVNGYCTHLLMLMGLQVNRYKV